MCPLCDHAITLYDNNSTFQALVGHAKVHARDASLSSAQWGEFTRWLASFKRRPCRCGHVGAFAGFQKHLRICVMRPAVPQAAPPPAGVASTAPDLLPGGPRLPSLGDIFGLPSTTIDHLPSTLRPALVPVVTKLFRDAAYVNSERSHVLLYLFFKTVLDAPDRGAASHTSVIQHRLSRWLLHEYSALWDELVARTTARAHARSKAPPSDRRRTADGRQPDVPRATVLVREGAFRKALQSLLSRGVQSASTAVLGIMRGLHPAGPPLSRARPSGRPRPSRDLGGRGGPSP